MKRLVLCLFVIASIAAAGPLWSAVASQQTTATLRVGDVVRIAGTRTECAVARRGGATTVECLPLKPAAGSYATIAGDRRVAVVRFRSAHVAKTVFEAKQHGGAVTCR